MRRKRSGLIIFILSSITLLISLKLFWNLGVYVDEYNSTPSVICGSEFWNYMSWLRLILLGVITVVSGISIFTKE